MAKLKSFKEHKDPIISVYHYTHSKFDSFDPSRLTGGNDQRGPGLYTSEEHETSYGPNLHHIRLDTSKFIKPGMKVKKSVIKDMIANSPHLEDVVSNYHENPKIGQKMLTDACAKAPDMHEAMERVWYDGYKADNHAFLEQASQHYHGTTVKPNKFRPGATHHIIWSEKAIKSIKHHE